MSAIITPSICIYTIIMIINYVFAAEQKYIAGIRDCTYTQHSTENNFSN